MRQIWDKMNCIANGERGGSGNHVSRKAAKVILLTKPTRGMVAEDHVYLLPEHKDKLSIRSSSNLDLIRKFARDELQIL